MCVNIPHTQIRSFYQLIAAADPNAFNMLLTVFDGKNAGEKCLLSSGNLMGELRRSGFFARHLQEIRDMTHGGVLELDGNRVLCELLGNEKKMVICGGGHVSQAVVKISLMLGLHVTVVEERPEFAEKARLAGVHRVICAPYEEGLQQIPGDSDTFFVIVTHAHRFDTQCLNAISRKPHAYIGMIGSRRRVALVKEYLISEAGCDPQVIQSVHSPIGLDIGSETPEEIAVSIMAEIIQVKNRERRNASWPPELLRSLTDPQTAETPRALATVVERRDSAPRDAGARMLIWPDGQIVGTIGGGILESKVIQTARRQLEAGDPSVRLLRVKLDAETPDADEMACGGEVSVLIEIT